jgi:hypothetical protein
MPFSAPGPNAETVIARLEEAGRTLLSLPNVGPSTRLVQSGLEWVRDASEHTASSRGRIRPSVPDALTITRMDQALAWIPLIPVDRYVLRRVVGARSLVNPMTARYLYSWRRLALAIGADHKAVQRWHAQGIDLIVAALSRPPGAQVCQPSLPTRLQPARAAVRSGRRGSPGVTGLS